MGSVRRIACSCLLLLLAPRPSPAQEDAPSPFAGVETRVLASGLKIWFKRTPGQPVAALSMAVPAGRDQEPPGRVAYRSIPVPLEEITELSPERLPGVWLTRRVWTCTPLLVGVLGPGIYLRRRAGHGYFFDLRDRDECLGLLRSLIDAGGRSAATGDTVARLPYPRR